MEAPAVLASSQAIAYIDRVNFAVVGPQLVKVYGYTPAQVGVLLSTFNWAFTFSLLAAGPLTDRIRPRRSYPLGVGTWSSATALCSLTRAFAPLSAFLVLLGVGESLMIPSGSRVIRETFDKKHRAFAVGTFFVRLERRGHIAGRKRRKLDLALAFRSGDGDGRIDGGRDRDQFG